MFHVCVVEIVCSFFFKHPLRLCIGVILSHYPHFPAKVDIMAFAQTWGCLNNCKNHRFGLHYPIIQRFWGVGLTVMLYKRMSKTSNFCQRKGRYEFEEKIRAYLNPIFNFKDLCRLMVSVHSGNDWTVVLDPVNL